MIFRLFRSRADRAMEHSAKELSHSAATVMEAMNLQLDMLVYFEGKRKRDFLINPYFARYAFGMIDAATTVLGLHLRQKLGRGLIEQWYVAYMTVETGMNEKTAREVIENLFSVYHAEGRRDAAVMDGGTDGVVVLQGGTASRLLDHFGAAEGDLSPEQARAFQAYHSRDRFA